MHLGCPKHRLRSDAYFAGRSFWLSAETEDCAADSEYAGVRCCNGSACVQVGYPWQGILYLKTSSKPPSTLAAPRARYSRNGSTLRYTTNGVKSSHAEAAHECKAQGMRLCRRSELRSGMCCFSGLGMDPRLVWTADACDTPSRGLEHSTRPIVVDRFPAASRTARAGQHTFDGEDALAKALVKDADPRVLEPLGSCNVRLVSGYFLDGAVGMGVGVGWAPGGGSNAPRVFLVANMEDYTGEEVARALLGHREFEPERDAAMIIGNWWNASHEQHLDLQRGIASLWVPWASLSWSAPHVRRESEGWSPLHLLQSARERRRAHPDTRRDTRRHAVAWQSNNCRADRGAFWSSLVAALPNKNAAAHLGDCDGSPPAKTPVGRTNRSVGSTRRYSDYEFVVVYEHGANRNGYLTEKIVDAFLAGTCRLLFRRPPRLARRPTPRRMDPAGSTQLSDRLTRERCRVRRCRATLHRRNDAAGWPAVRRAHLRERPHAGRSRHSGTRSAAHRGRPHLAFATAGHTATLGGVAASLLFVAPFGLGGWLRRRPASAHPQ